MIHCKKIQIDIELDGIVEADETFLPVSYKGNHKNSKIFVMPRPAHHRGHSVKKKGLSNDQVCIPCAVNRKGKSVAKVGKLGKVNTLCIENIVGKQIKNSSILCTDKEQAYRQFSKLHNLKLIQLDTGEVFNARSADREITQSKKYIIPDFVIPDDNGKKLHIQNLLCTTSNVDGLNVDILLAGCLFRDTSMTLKPVRRTDNNIHRVMIIDTPLYMAGLL